MRKQKKIVTLLVAMTFLVVGVSGFVAFLCPFSMTVSGLHSLMGFTFIVLIGLHIKQNIKKMKQSVVKAVVFPQKNTIFTRNPVKFNDTY